MRLFRVPVIPKEYRRLYEAAALMVEFHTDEKTRKEYNAYGRRLDALVAALRAIDLAHKP